MRPCRPFPRSSALLLPALALTFFACAREAAPPPAPALVRVELGGAGLAVASVPAAFRLVSSGPVEARFAPAPAAGAPVAPGELLLTVAPPTKSGINLIQLVKDSRAEFEGRAGGEFLGQRELVVPWGSAFTARGRFAEGGGQIEELRLFALHPGDMDRLLTVVYRYPMTTAEDSSRRFGEALAVLGELESTLPKT